LTGDGDRMPPSRKDWERVGPMLAERRVQISARYANRRAFADDVGLNWRTLYDAEYGKRATFRAETIRAFESAYRLVPGSLARTLAGGDLEPAPPSLAAAVPLSGSGALTVGGDDEAMAREAEILFPGDRTKQAIWRTREPREVKLEIIALIDRKRGTAPPARDESAAGLTLPPIDGIAYARSRDGHNMCIS
jgi:hypothetical protein